MGEISPSQSVMSMLKIWYKDGVQNLMFRNSPVLKALNKVRVEGKQQNFNAMYGRGGACSASFTTARQNAQNAGKDVEFTVKPGQLFSVYTMNAKEVQASMTRRGAYMKVAGMKMFAASEAFRKTLAAALYGRGFGEIAVLPSNTATGIETSGVDLTLPADAIMKIDVGSWIEFKEEIGSATSKGTAVVNTINGNKVNVSAINARFDVAAGDIVCIAGSMDSAGDALLPMGLDGWLPAVENRTSTEWDAYIETPFAGVKRSVCADRLAGAFVVGAGPDKISKTVQALLLKCRRQGSQADMIVMNDQDFLEMAGEIEATNTYFTQTSTKEKKQASIGMSAFSASFSTNFIENIIDDPYCPAHKFYILDSSAVELWSYTNVDKVDDGIAGNNPGKQDPMTMDNEGKEKEPYALIIDDYLNVQPGSGSNDGPDVQVTLQFFGSFVVTNPSVCGVGILKADTDFIGYTK